MLLSGDTRREPVSLLAWVVGRNCVLPSGCRTEILFSCWLIALRFQRLSHSLVCGPRPLYSELTAAGGVLVFHPSAPAGKSSLLLRTHVIRWEPLGQCRINLPHLQVCTLNHVAEFLLLCKVTLSHVPGDQNVDIVGGSVGVVSFHPHH